MRGSGSRTISAVRLRCRASRFWETSSSVPPASIQALLLAPQHRRREIEPERVARPPSAGRPALRDAREAIVVEQRADVARRLAIKRVAGKKAQDLGRALEQPGDEG